MLAFLLSFPAVGSAAAGPMMEAAGKQAWQTQNFKTLKALFSHEDRIQAFLYELNPVLEDLEAHVGEYEIIDLNNDGNVELLATIDTSGRGLYNTLYIIHNTNGILQIFKIGDYPSINDLRSRLVDLDRDGSKEILVPRMLVEYQGARPTPIINDVYKWNGTGYVTANALFKNYYRNLLPRLQAAFDAARQGRRIGSQTSEPSEKPMLEKKYEEEIKAVKKILNQQERTTIN